MEDDIDIYADLPSFSNLNLDKNDQLCNCEKLKKELNSSEIKLENIKKIKENLERNLSSLLKTARAEIARKDKMISDLRKRLDDATFRRNNKGESRDFSAHRSSHQWHMMVEKYENSPSMHSQEDETDFHHNEPKSKKPQYDSQLPTVFAERLQKRIIKEEKEDIMQKTSLKLDVEANSNEIPEEIIVESNKENGSQSIMNNNGSECNTITRHSDSENPCRKNSGKRMNEEDDTHGNKRLKIDDNEDKTTIKTETDYDCTVQYELRNNLTQYEMKDNLAKFAIKTETDYDCTVQYELKNNLTQYEKDLVKLEDRLNVCHSLKEEEVPLDKRRAASEHQDMMKQNRDYTNGWKREERSNFRTSATSNLEEPNNSYKKNDYRYNPSRRSYSRNRIDYESSSGHHLRERSHRTYRNKKYENYKYDNQYRTKRDYRLKRDYERVENESKTRRRSRECNDLVRDKPRHSSSDEDKEGNSSCKNKRYENLRIKEIAVNKVVLHNKKHERNKATADMDPRVSSSHTIVNNTLNHSAKKTEQDKIKNESNIKIINSIESTSTYTVTNDSSNLEEGEIVDSPEKKIDSLKIFKDHKTIDTKIVLIEDKNENVPVASITDNKSILQNDIIIAKQLDSVTDISTKEVEATSCLVQTILKDSEEIAELNSSGKKDAVVDEVRNREDICKVQYNEQLADSTICTIGMIEQIRDSNVDDDDKSRAEEESKTFVTKAIKIEESRAEEESKTSVTEAIKIEEMADSNTENITEVRKIDDLNIESATKDKVSNSNIENPVTIAEANNSDNSTRKIDDEELKSNITEVVVKVKAMLNCDIENRDENLKLPIESETSRWISDKSNIEMSHLCLGDHNYVQDPPPVNTSDPDVVRESPASPEHCKTVSEIATLKEIKAEEKTDISLTIKKTMSSTMKNKKNQQSKGVVISRRRRAVMLSDNNASMTVLMNTKMSSNVISSSNNESVLKPRACKASRACK